MGVNRHLLLLLTKIVILASTGKKAGSSIATIRQASFVVAGRASLGAGPMMRASLSCLPPGEGFAERAAFDREYV
jgi:hypothetical protein